MPGISGYVLAGGESSRMQPADGARVDKALLMFRGETLLERALRTVAAVCGDVAILGGPAERGVRFASYGRVVADRVVGCGPLGGLVAALEDASHDSVLVMPVDLPLLSVSGLSALVAAASQGMVVCFGGGDWPQPLPVVLHRSVAPMLVDALERGERTLMPVLQRCGLVAVPVGDSVWLTNVNTPEEFVGLG